MKNREEEVDKRIIMSVREAVDKDGSLVQVLNLIHDATGTQRYRRMPTLRFLSEAVGLSLRDFQTWLAPCRLFDPTGHVSINEAERCFGKWKMSRPQNRDLVDDREEEK